MLLLLGALVVGAGDAHAAPHVPVLSGEDWERLRAGEVVLSAEADGERVTATGVILVHVPPALAWPAVLDIRARVRESPTLRAVTEYRREGATRWSVRVDMEVMGVELRVHNRYTFEPARNLASYTLDLEQPNELSICDGWYLASATEAGTLLVYEAVTEARVYVPAWVRRWLARDQMAELLGAIRARAEGAAR